MRKLFCVCVFQLCVISSVGQRSREPAAVPHNITVIHLRCLFFSGQNKSVPLENAEEREILMVFLHAGSGGGYTWVEYKEEGERKWSLDLRSLKAGQRRRSHDSSKYFTLSFISSVYEHKYDERDARRRKNVVPGLEAVRLIV